MPERDAKRPPFYPSTPIVFALLLLTALAVSSVLTSKPAPKRVPYSEFLADLRSDRLARVEVQADEIVAELKPGLVTVSSEKAANEKAAKEKAANEAPTGSAISNEPGKVGEGRGPAPETIERPSALAKVRGEAVERITTERIPRVEENALIDEMMAHGVELSGRSDEPSWMASVFYGWVIPVALISLIYFVGMRRLQGRGGPMSFGKNRAKLYDASREQKVTFRDVAGVDEAVAEMTEVVDFLANPAKYRSLGAKIPKGVLLVGPPGTGKTLMAKAVAGEAGVPFFSMSGSDFVEMFVGVGAARVRDLFEQAKARSPCIIFIDEIDAIGKSRAGIGAIATHDEREQTLNQLLSEMDGFDATQGVVIIAATNRPEVLDPALVRAGRFDRQVLIDRPSWDGRLAILKVHTRDLVLARGVNLEVVARRTPGMVGADLAKVVNEAALAAARRGAAEVDQRDFEEAVDRIQLGLRKRGHAMNEEEKRRVAFHESGHALVALSVEHADPVHRVTIIPRTIGALGATLQLPTEDRYLMLKKELADRIAVMLGGRAAEELVTGDVSTGAQNDLERATETARQMVCRFGMSDKLGVQTFGKPMGARFLDTPLALGDERNFSDDTARAIDAEVHAIMEREYKRALEILERRRELLEDLAKRLIENETLEKSDIDVLLATAAVKEKERAEQRARLARVAT